VATGELYPVECDQRLCELIRTGDEVELDLDANTLKAAGKTFATKSLGDARPVIDAGGIFEYARRTGMISAQGNHSKATEALAAKEPPDD
jgi:3-isopropylmalate/(R)-2-methylmalate dehydratase small subunit